MTARILLVTLERGAGWDESRIMDEQRYWNEHATFMNALVAEGFIVLGGPVVGTPDALLVVRARDEEEVRLRLASDPWIRADIRRITHVRPWFVRLGALPAG